MTFTMPDPPDSSYPWKTGRQIFGYPLATVFALSKDEADQIANPQPFDGVVAFYCHLDSAEAVNRLGLWGDVEGQKTMERGD